jgi:hypothetical protein
MTADQVPPVPTRYQSTHPRHADQVRASSGPAWRAGWRLLSDLEPHPRAEVIATMRAANPIAYRTARDILTQAVNAGLIEVVSRDRYTRPTLRRKA